MLISYVFADSPHEINTSIYLALRPAFAINREGSNTAFTMHINDFDDHKPEAVRLLDKSQVIIVERNLTRKTIDRVEYWKSQGKLVVAIFDDAYHLMTTDNPAYGYWHQGQRSMYDQNGNFIKHDYMEEKPLDVFKEALSHFHGYICPSKVLVDDFKEFGKGYFLPHFFETLQYRQVPEKKDDGFINIFWGGSLSHFKSFTDSGVNQALKRICEKYPKVRVAIAGDKRVIDQIKVPDNQKIYFPYVHHERWPENIVQADIGIAPLAGSYDRRRSWIKVAEYMLMKKPWIASLHDAYDEYSECGCLIKNTPKNWQMAIEDILENLPEKRYFAKGKPFDYAMQYDIRNNLNVFTNLYKQIAEDNGVRL